MSLMDHYSIGMKSVDGAPTAAGATATNATIHSIVTAPPDGRISCSTSHELGDSLDDDR